MQFYGNGMLKKTENTTILFPILDAFANNVKYVNYTTMMKCADNSFDQNILMLRILVGIAWVLAVVLASPQAVIWRVLKHPHRLPEFYQVGRCQVNSFLSSSWNYTFFLWVDMFDYNFIVHTDVQMRADKAKVSVYYTRKIWLEGRKSSAIKS